MDFDSVGARLIAARGKRNRKTVADAVGISVSALAMYETGHRIPRDEIKVKLAEFYKKSVQSLFY